MPSLVEASRALTPWQREFRIVRDGAVRWIDARAVPERTPDGTTLWHGFASDVTERKEIELALRRSEERWGLAAEAAGIGIAQLDLASGLLSFDARACANASNRVGVASTLNPDGSGSVTSTGAGGSVDSTDSPGPRCPCPAAVADRSNSVADPSGGRDHSVTLGARLPQKRLWNIPRATV